MLSVCIQASLNVLRLCAYLCRLLVLAVADLLGSVHPHQLDREPRRVHCRLVSGMDLELYDAWLLPARIMQLCHAMHKLGRCRRLLHRRTPLRDTDVQGAISAITSPAHRSNSEAIMLARVCAPACSPGALDQGTFRQPHAGSRCTTRSSSSCYCG